jgi:uncharacterized membrane protein HdeD (DUF308 family)
MIHAYNLENTNSSWNDAVEAISSHRGWFTGAGVLMMVMGAAGAYYSTATTLISMSILGMFLLVGAFLHIGQGLASRHWSIFLIQTLVAVISVVTGLIVLHQPLAIAGMITLLMAIFFMTTGLIKIVTALVLQMPKWGSWVLNGIVTMLFGFMVLNQWPVSGLSVIGIFLGTDIMLHGASLVFLGSTIGRQVDPIPF